MTTVPIPHGGHAKGKVIFSSLRRLSRECGEGRGASLTARARTIARTGLPGICPVSRSPELRDRFQLLECRRERVPRRCWIRYLRKSVFVSLCLDDSRGESWHQAVILGSTDTHDLAHFEAGRLPRTVESEIDIQPAKAKEGASRARFWAHSKPV